MQQARASALVILQSVRARAEQRYIAQHALRATDAEIAEVLAYEAAFARHDRSQRALKRTELERRLEQWPPGVDAATREWLIEFHTVLERLETYEADVDRGVEPRTEVSKDTLRQWVEQAKLDAALFAELGGVVALVPAGARAHGARAALVAQALEREPVAFPDAEVEREFQCLLWAPPAIVFSGETPDFTPFWRRPMKSSYVAP